MAAETQGSREQEAGVRTGRALPQAPGMDTCLPPEVAVGTRGTLSGRVPGRGTGRELSRHACPRPLRQPSVSLGGAQRAQWWLWTALLRLPPTPRPAVIPCFLGLVLQRQAPAPQSPGWAVPRRPRRRWCIPGVGACDVSALPTLSRSAAGPRLRMDCHLSPVTVTRAVSGFSFISVI